MTWKERFIKGAPSLRDQLPLDIENTLVWCERCQREHRHYTFTRGDYDALIAKQARALSAVIDNDIMTEIVKRLIDAE